MTQTAKPSRCHHLKITGKRSLLRRLSGLAVFVCAAGLAYTGFYGMPRQADTPGYARMVHVTFGSVFSVSLMVWAVMSAQIHRFSEVNWSWLKSLSDPDYLAYPDTAQKCCFWMMMVSGVFVIGAVVLNMFAWFSMDQQSCVVTVHIRSAVVFASCTALYALLTIRQCLSRRDF